MSNANETVLTDAEEAVRRLDEGQVDLFAIAMKEKLAIARAKGRGGWQLCSPIDLSQMLREHVDKGDPRDVANFCMFLWATGEGIATQGTIANDAVLGADDFRFALQNIANGIPNAAGYASKILALQPSAQPSDMPACKACDDEGVVYDEEGMKPCGACQDIDDAAPQVAQPSAEAMPQYACSSIEGKWFICDHDRFHKNMWFMLIGGYMKCAVRLSDGTGIQYFECKPNELLNAGQTAAIFGKATPPTVDQDGVKG